MRNKLLKLGSLLLFITFLVVAVMGCNALSPLVGKWQDMRTGSIIEFTWDGKLVCETNSGYTLTGTYERIGDDYVKIKFEGFGGAWISMFGADTWKYQISGDTMTTQIAGQTTTARRVR